MQLLSFVFFGILSLSKVGAIGLHTPHTRAALPIDLSILDIVQQYVNKQLKNYNLVVPSFLLLISLQSQCSIPPPTPDYACTANVFETYTTFILQIQMHIHVPICEYCRHIFCINMVV